MCFESVGLYLNLKVTLLPTVWPISSKSKSLPIFVKERELIFKASDIMVLPFEEVYQSASILMGMSYSLPVITSDILGFKEFIKDGFNGLLFKKNDSNDLYQKINIIFNDNNLFKKLEKNSLLTMKRNFSWHNIALQYKNILLYYN